ncbi:hypothetical protein RF11_03847 [Thelohanellus kitauei]|uniref:Uncharacterized protein n=1 Tax=Thelohanellus kitauei TaxID=669202 RepID=A0A0C2MUX5_THEKT|nr:hypothetical protein RF11_03847 [Thelohanellus kitauei]
MWLGKTHEDEACRLPSPSGVRDILASSFDAQSPELTQSLERIMNSFSLVSLRVNSIILIQSYICSIVPHGCKLNVTLMRSAIWSILERLRNFYTLFPDFCISWHCADVTTNTANKAELFHLQVKNIEAIPEQFTCFLRIVTTSAATPAPTKSQGYCPFWLARAIDNSHLQLFDARICRAFLEVTGHPLDCEKLVETSLL